MPPLDLGADGRNLLKRYMGHVHLNNPTDFFPNEQAIINSIGLELWPPDSSPNPPAKRIKTLYMLDQYPLWTAPHPQPISNYRSILSSKVDAWLVWTLYMQMYHIKPSIEDAIKNHSEHPIYFGPKIDPTDLTFDVDAKDSILEAEPYWHMFNRLYADELVGDQAQNDRYFQAMYDYMAGLGLSWLPLDVNYTYKQIMTTDGWKSKFVDRIGIEIYPATSLQDDETTLKAEVKRLVDDQKTRVESGGRKVSFIIFMSYNRNGQWTNFKTLRLVQQWTHEFCKSFADEYWYFNAGRDDAENLGALAIPQMIETHDAIRSEIHAQ